MNAESCIINKIRVDKEEGMTFRIELLMALVKEKVKNKQTSLICGKLDVPFHRSKSCFRSKDYSKPGMLLDLNEDESNFPCLHPSLYLSCFQGSRGFV